MVRKIGVVGLTAYGVGSILGAGVYALIGAAAGIAGEGLWLAFLLAAFIALFTGFSYAELATLFPRAGAEYHFVRNGFGNQRLAFVAGWALIVGTVTTVATVALAFAGYLEGITGIPQPLSAFLLIGVLSAINFIGIRESTTINVLLTIIEVGGLLLVVAIGLSQGLDAFIPSPPEQPETIFSAAALLFFSYLGFEQIANLAEESRNPQRILPLALLGAIAISTLLYVLVALAVLALVAPKELAASSAPLALVTSLVLGRTGAIVMTIIALLATMNTALLQLIASSRLVFGMAREGALPTPLTAINPSTHTPALAIIALTLVSWAFLPLGSVRLVGSLASFNLLFVFALVNLALIRLRYIAPAADRPFRSPLSIGRLPLLAALGALTAIGSALLLGLDALLIGTAVLAVGLVVSFILPVDRMG